MSFFIWQKKGLCVISIYLSIYLPIYVCILYLTQNYQQNLYPEPGASE